MPEAGPKRRHHSTQYAVLDTIPISVRSGIRDLISCSSRFAEGASPSERCGFSDGMPVSASMTRPSLSGYPASAAAAADRSLSSNCRRKNRASNPSVSPASHRPTSTR
ncbi:hypothetical protein ACFY2M_36375 [Streptomyces sp. NPDC001276]|uniref:hypothetical protein n=1 Tax=Streptomyces sp. NPDC001276 TaxID=3364555 RepID=UPI00368CD04E